MSIETLTKDIDGFTITVTQFPAREGLKVQTKLLRLLAPSLFAVAGSARSVASVLDADISQAIKELMSRLDEDVVLSTILSKIGRAHV
jgi:hypothetical protein